MAIDITKLTTNDLKRIAATLQTLSGIGAIKDSPQFAHFRDSLDKVEGDLRDTLPDGIEVEADLNDVLARIEAKGAAELAALALKGGA